MDDKDTDEVQIKLSKMFVRDVFKGYVITANGKMLSNQVSTVVNTEPHQIPRVTVTFNIRNDMMIDSPDIHLKD